MPSGPQRSQGSPGPLGEQQVDARQIADRAVSTWQDVESALSPIIGKMGVVALFDRSVHLTRTAHPCLSAVQATALDADRFSALKTTLSGQTVSNAASANDALLRTFHDLLTGLIGESLTARLLRSVRESPFRGVAEQDTSR